MPRFKAKVGYGRSPVWTNAPTNLNLEAGQTYNFATFCSDPDFSPLTFSLVNPASGYSITSAGLMTAGAATSAVTVRASDGALTKDHVCTVTIQEPEQPLAWSIPDTLYALANKVAGSADEVELSSLYTKPASSTEILTLTADSSGLCSISGTKLIRPSLPVSSYTATIALADGVTSAGDRDFGYSVTAGTGFTLDPAFAAAGGSVSAPSGFANGATITIQGSGFGTMGGDVIQYLRGDERGDGQLIHGTPATIGATVDTLIVEQGDGYNGDDVLGKHLRFSTARPRAGRTASLRRVNQDSTGYYRGGGFGVSGINKTRLYVRWWGYNYIPAWTTVGTNYKQFYAFGTASDAPQAMLFVPAGSSTWGFYQNIGDGSLDYNTRNNLNTAGWNVTNTDNEWALWECYFELGAVGAYNGICRVWRNNVKGIENTAWLSRNVNGVYKQWYLGYMDKAMTGATFDFSDVYVADTVARVEIADSPTWGASAAKEIQPARNAGWSDTAVSATLNHGAFTSLTGKYLYLVKSDGTAVNIGSFN